MSRQSVAPPKVLYEFVDNDDTQAVDDVFNFLFDHFFAQKEWTENVEKVIDIYL